MTNVFCLNEDCKNKTDSGYCECSYISLEPKGSDDNEMRCEQYQKEDLGK